jgi:hypothetical protein
MRHNTAARPLAQSILAPAPLPAMRVLRTLLFLTLAAVPLGAQSRLAADTDVRASPTGNPVAMLKGGTSWSTGTTRNGWTLVSIQGWVESSRFAGPRDSFPQSIGGAATLRIREEPSLDGRILGEFRGGAGLRIVERRGNWAKIRRDAWIPAGSFTTAASRTPARPEPTPPAATRPESSPARGNTPAPATPAEPVATPAIQGGLRADAPASLRTAPGGAAVGELAQGAVVEPLARDRGWVKVRVDAWVPESLFVPADTAYRSELTAIDLRLDPEGTKGRVVRWEVQVVGLQRADPLRRDLAPDEPFLLAIGPKGENVILYVAVPASLLNEAKAIPSMQSVILTARVRTGRSRPTGAPILDLLSFVRR